MNAKIANKKSIFYKLLLLFVFLIVIMATFIGTLFTPFGNNIVANYLLSYLNKKTSIEWTKEDFSLGFTKINLHFSSKDKQLEFFIDGNYSLFLQTLDLNFLAQSNGFDFKALNKDLHLPKNLLLNGKITGSFNHYSIANKEDSSHSFKAVLSYLTPQSLDINLKQIPLADVLESLKEKKYADGLLDIDSKIEWINKIPNGTLKANLEGGYAIEQTFLEEFDLKIPTTNFMADLNLTLKDNLLKHNFNLYSNLGEIKTKGNTQIKTLSMDTNYEATFSNLSPLSAFFKFPTQGSFNAKGILKGDLYNMLAMGDLSLQNSKINYTLNLDNFYPKTLQMSSNNLQAKDLFMFFGQKPYLEGNFNLNINLRDFLKGISGTATLDSKNLFINSPLIEEKTQLGFPHTTFNFFSQLELAEGKGIFNLDFNSNLLNLKIQNASYALINNIKAPISLQFPKLQNISFNNKSLPNGELKLQGNLTDTNLYLEGEILQNNQSIKTTILNMKNRLSLNLSNVSTSEIYRIFNYPHFFKGIGDFTFTHHNDVQEILFSSKNLTLNNPLLKAIEKSSKMSFKNTNFTGTFSQTLTNENLITTRFTLEKDNLKLFNYTDLITKDSNTRGTFDLLRFDNYPYQSKSFSLDF